MGSRSVQTGSVLFIAPQGYFCLIAVAHIGVGLDPGDRRPEHGLPGEGEEWPPLPPDPEAEPEPPVGQKEESTETETAEVEMTP